MKFLVAFLVVLLVSGVSFLITSAFVAVICWAVSIDFLWKYTFGAWAAIMLIKGISK